MSTSALVVFLLAAGSFLVWSVLRQRRILKWPVVEAAVVEREPIPARRPKWKCRFEYPGFSGTEIGQYYSQAYPPDTIEIRLDPADSRNWSLHKPKDNPIRMSLAALAFLAVLYWVLGRAHAA